MDFQATELQQRMEYAQANNPTVLINLWAPPGVGKSTTMAAIFNVLKHRGRRAEMAPEVAKLHTYENNRMALTDPFYAAACQEYRCHMLRGQVDYIVTDSPPALACIYCRKEDMEAVFEMARHCRRRYINVDVRLTRDPTRTFQTYGRNHTEEQSRALEGRLDRLLSRLTNDEYRTIADRAAPEEIIRFCDEEVLGYAPQ